MAQEGQENKLVVFFLSDKHDNLQQLFSLYTYIYKNYSNVLAVTDYWDFALILLFNCNLNVQTTRIHILLKRPIPTSSSTKPFLYWLFCISTSSLNILKSSSDGEAQMLTTWHFLEHQTNNIWTVTFTQRYCYFKHRVTTSACAECRNL